MLDHWVFGLVSCTYNISLTALLNKAWVSRAWSPTKFGFTPFKAFPIQEFKKLVSLDSPINCLIRVAEKRALHLCSIITRPSPPSINFGCDCSRVIRSKRFLQMNLLHAFFMSISLFFDRGKTFARWMNLGTMNLLKNCALCRTVSLRFQAPHKLILTLVCNWFKFIVTVSSAVGQKTIPRTFMFGEEVNHSKGHCFLSFQIPRPSNLVF